MIDKSLFVSILFGLATFYLAIGIWSSRKVKTLQDYFLADRNLGIFQLTFTLVATQLGSGLLLGTSTRAYHLGLYGILYTVGMSLGFIILGCGLASRMRALNINTTAEIFETHYKSSTLKLFASACSIVSLWGILLAQIVASHTLFLGLGIHDPYILTSFWLFLIFYTMLGGLTSVIIIDVLQVVFILSIFSFLFLKTAITSPDQIITTLQTHRNIELPSLTSILPTLFVPTLFSLIEQDLAQRFFAAKTRKTATIGAFCASAIIILFSCIPMFFGMIARTQQLVLTPGASPLIPVLAQLAAKVPFILAICGIIAAITSTADSLLCAVSSNIVQDFSNFLPKTNKKLHVSKAVSFITGLTALMVSFFIKDDIIAILESSYRLSVSCLFIPTIFAYLQKDLQPEAAWTSVCLGVIGFVYGILFIPYSIARDLLPVILSLTGYLIAHIFFKKRAHFTS